MYDNSSDWTPITMWGYFGYQLIFSIPIVGLIMAIIWSVSAKNQNLKNYARSQFCWLIIYLIILMIIISTVGLGTLFGGTYY